MDNWLPWKTWMHTRWLLCVSLVALTGYGIFIGANYAPVAAGSDSAGYLGSARLLSQGRLETALRMIPEFSARRLESHAPLGFAPAENGLIIRPSYPIGLPLHFALGSWMAGWYWGPVMIGVLGALAAVIICYFCARELEIDPILAVSGAVALAVSPVYLYTSFLPMSDTIATAWCGAAFLAALRARQAMGWALACGLAFSIAVLVRPTNLILLPTLTLVLWNLRNLWWAALGALPGAALDACYNAAMYGGIFRSGYGSIFESFAKRFFPLSLANYGETLPYALPLMFVGVVLLPAMPWRKRPRELCACMLWAASFMLFYAFYEFTEQTWWFLRFILPAFPALILLGLCGLDTTIGRAGARSQCLKRVAAILVIIASIAGCVHIARERHLMSLRQYQEPYVDVTTWAKQNLPANAFVAAMQTSASLYYYTNFPVLRWDAVEPLDVARLATSLHDSGRPLYAVLFPFEYERARTTLAPGDWRKIVEVKGVTVWQITLRSQ